MEEMQKQTEIVSPDQQEAVVGDKDRTAFCNKFATADELEKAYDNLQREFTKKCQANSRLSRELDELKSVAKNAEEKADLYAVKPPAAQTEGREKETPTEEISAAAKTPAYELPDWESIVAEFMKKYPSAERYTQKIAKALAEDRDLAMADNCLERAYFNVLLKGDKPYDQLASDEEFLEKYVYCNQKVKDRIIEEFLLKNINEDAPRTIAASGRTHVTPPSRPKSIREAGGIVKNMLANRRI